MRGCDIIECVQIAVVVYSHVNLNEVELGSLAAIQFELELLHGPRDVTIL